MLTLKKITIHKYKCFETEQSFDVDKDVTVLVGLNESGKTSVLEAIAKTNYFEDDSAFTFSTTHDYPRKEKKRMEKSGIAQSAVTSVFGLSDEFREAVNAELGADVLKSKSVSITERYNKRRTFDGITVNLKSYLGHLHADLPAKMTDVKNQQQIDALVAEEESEKLLAALQHVRQFYENKWEWDNPVEEYVCRTWVGDHQPKYLYYDEYYALPSRISIEDLQNEELTSEEQKTAKALFDLAEIDINELIESDDFEDFKAELEATEAIISGELFEYWSTNQNLEIRFDIDKIERQINPQNAQIVEHILDIRVRNSRAKVSLPLKNRSKGFNWFFSFLVWFKRIQEDQDSNYILLLDEPGLNLHASAQKDLLLFLESLSPNYQIVYTTHSPFMVPPDKLHRVRTVLETNEGSVISETIQEKDPDTLFPLQAALGYDIAQNLYISKKNLLVEGISDLVFLNVVSSYLEEMDRAFLSPDITIVPVGGLEKVATFVSLLRGSNLNVVCMLDSTVGQSSQAKLERLISDKIIREQKVLRYRDFITGAKEADVEDLFELDTYIALFNGAFHERPDVSGNDLKQYANDRMVVKLNKHLGVKRFNHYRPSNFLASQGVAAAGTDTNTLDRFEAMFKAVNEAMKR